MTRASRRAATAAALAISAGAAIPVTPAAAQEASARLPFDPCAMLSENAVTDLSGPAEELLRWGEITGVLPQRARSIRRPSDDVARPPCQGADARAAAEYVWGPARISALPVRLGFSHNGAYPDDRNNGALWAGRGAAGLLTAGIRVEAGPLSAGLAPTLVYQENQPFETRSTTRPGYSDLVNPFYVGIDLPQRFGEESYSETSWGQSYLRIDAFGVAAGISTENLWVGPAARYPILMSNTAPGFRHLFLGTSTPVDLWLAKVHGQLMLGRLEESDYFDSVPENDESRLAMLVLTVQPRWLDGLELGFARSYMYRPTEGDNDLAALFRPSDTNLPGNELASIFARWAFVESGAEIYGEWARDDRYATLEDDLIPEIDHSQAYMIGFQKVTGIGGSGAAPRAVRVRGELVHLQEKAEPRPGRPLPTYYTHSQVRQGYTHRGQLLGAAVGPGGDGQFIGVDALFPWGMAGAFVERVRRNDSSTAARQARFSFPYDHDTELTGGVRGMVLLGELVLEGSVGYGKRWSRDFLHDDEGVKIELDLQWWPGTWP